MRVGRAGSGAGRGALLAGLLLLGACSFDLSRTPAGERSLDTARPDGARDLPGPSERAAADQPGPDAPGGDGTAGWQDGPGPTARFSSPAGIAVVPAPAAGKSPTIVVADTGNHCIRAIALP